MTALEKKGKPNNPLTKRLMQKVQTEWDKAVAKKRQDFGVVDDVNEVEVLVEVIALEWNRYFDAIDEAV